MNFKQKVINIVSKVPKGNVASYGQIALMAGAPRAGRAVGQVLKSMELDILKGAPDIPWWRIVNNSGRVSIKGTKFHDAVMQRKPLIQESVRVQSDYTFDIEKYRWRPSPNELEDLELSTGYIEQLSIRFQL